MGIMSSTSLDGVDVVFCEIEESSCTLLESIEFPFPPALKSELMGMIAGQCTLEEVGRTDHSLGLLFTEVDASTVRAIGLHGQTL